MEAGGGIGVRSSPLATPPWAVRIRRADGEIAGSGILLGPDRVLTCAHVLDRDEEVVAEFVGAAGRHVPRIDARVAGDAYRPEERDADGDPSGDVALLQLASPRPESETTTLHRLSAPGREVRMYGFPAAYNGGLWLPATIVGGCGRDGQVQLRPPSPAEVARPGFSGGGVVDLATDKVVGVVLAGAAEHGAGYSFMSPAETVVQHLPEVRAWTRGQSAVDEELRSPEAGAEPAPLDQPFAERLARWLRGDAVERGDGAAARVKISLVPESDTARAATLRRAVTLADRELRTRLSVGRASLDAPGTVPAAGALDLALYVAGRDTESLAERIARRMGLWQRQDLPAAERIAAARVTITLVVVGVDAAADPASLLDLMAVLVAGGSRVLLVFRTAGDHFARAREELLLRPAQERRAALARRYARICGPDARLLAALTARVSGAAELTEPAVAALVRAHSANRELTRSQGPFALAPDEAPDPARYERIAGRAEQLIVPAVTALSELLDRRDELRGVLVAYRRLYEEGAARGEDLAADGLYLIAHRLLHERPCDVAAAQEAVAAFRAYVDALPPRGPQPPAPDDAGPVPQPPQPPQPPVPPAEDRDVRGPAAQAPYAPDPGAQGPGAGGAAT
ncbi:S1 family peptidase [Actinacidiphila epipremni]|uniref:Trypsin-like peptidase domain-containing protein n=1 Tax=Actinacidiphila epipremni TaxID=2053013 RepID=A0ABX0ZJ50_9ACTN|nr:serine protease [Actinacidiphila epipremni]NJP42219.1 trypsin-like peptidase domain-containing protein [Actinacidiphila epipremni]